MKHFLYLLKKVVRKLYHLIWFLSLFILFISPVFAARTPIWSSGKEIIAPQSMLLADNTNMQLTGLQTAPDSQYDYIYRTNNVTTNGANSSGANVVFQTMDPFIAGYTYALTIYLHTGNLIPKSSSTRVCVADDKFAMLGFYNENNSYRCNNAIGVYSNQSAADLFYPDSSLYPSYEWYSVTYIFVPVYTGYVFTGSYNTTQAGTTVHMFLGYHYDILSDNKNLTQSQITSAVQSSGLATANSVQQVQQSLNEVKQELNDVSQSVDNVNDTLKNDDAPTIDLTDIQTSNTPISDLVTLPLNLLNSIYSGISGSCSNWSLLLPFNHTILLQCFTISDYVGSSVATIIDCAICLFMAYRIILLFIAIFNDITTLSDTYTNWVKRGRY